MSNGLTFIYYFVTKLINLFFNSFVVDGATFGWIIFAVLAMGMIIKTLLNLVGGISINVRQFQRGKNNE